MKIKEFDIVVSDYPELIKKLQSLSSMNLFLLHRYQQEKRFYPNSDAFLKYC